MALIACPCHFKFLFFHRNEEYINYLRCSKFQIGKTYDYKIVLQNRNQISSFLTFSFNLIQQKVPFIVTVSSSFVSSFQYPLTVLCHNFTFAIFLINNNALFNYCIFSSVVLKTNAPSFIRWVLQTDSSFLFVFS